MAHDMKHTLKNYLFWHDVYRQYFSATRKPWQKSPPGHSETELLKRLLEERNDLQFYTLKISEITKDGSKRTWLAHIFLSPGEAMAHKRVVTGCHRYGFRLQVESVTTAEIIELSKEEILAGDDHIKALLSRIGHITPYAQDDIDAFGGEEKIVWFIHGYERWHLVLKNDTLLFPSGWEKSTVGFGSENIYDEAGNIGLYDNNSGRLALPLIYKYIRVKGFLAEVSTKEQLGFDYKKLVCDILDIRQMHQVNDPKEDVVRGSLENHIFVVVKENKLRFKATINKQTKREKRGFTNPIDVISYYLNAESCDDLLPFNDNRAAFKKEGLWGYLDSDGRRVIEPQFLQGRFFNDGHAVVSHKESPDCEMVIDRYGGTVLESRYPRIEHHTGDLFFVKKEPGVWECLTSKERWALFKRDKVLVDFRTIKKSYEAELKAALVKRKKALQKKRYTLDLKGYVALFPAMRTEKDLMEAGLWGHPVRVKKTLGIYEDLIADKGAGRIGWRYPVTAGAFDLEKEMPVIFGKKDGDEISIGISFDALELEKNRW